MKRVLSMLLALCLIFGQAPAALASEATEQPPDETIVQEVVEEEASTLDAATLYWPVPGHTRLSQPYSDGHKAIDINDGSINGATIVAAIGEGAFNKITARAYYPDGNETWTADVRQSYGGTITWIAE